MLTAALLPMAYEFRVRLPDGSYRWLASRSAPVLDESGRQVRRVGVNWDITENKNAELARQQAELAEREIQAKSQFLSRMSHELRTPLNAVLGFTQLLQIEARKDRHADQLAKLGHIRAAGDHLLSLINDVLDLSGLEAGEVRLSLQAVDLGALVRAVAAAAAVAGRAARRRRRRRQQRWPRPRRPDAAAPGADQPDLERDQVQPARRQGRGRRPATTASSRR